MKQLAVMVMDVVNVHMKKTDIQFILIAVFLLVCLILSK